MYTDRILERWEKFFVLGGSSDDIDTLFTLADFSLHRERERERKRGRERERERISVDFGEQSESLSRALCI